MAPGLPKGSVLYTDAGYTDYAGEDLFEEATGSRQQTARKKNSPRPRAPRQTFMLQHFRKSIETCFDQLAARFPKQIHAVTATGFVLKLVLFISFTLLTKPAYRPQLGLSRIKERHAARSAA